MLHSHLHPHVEYSKSNFLSVEERKQQYTRELKLASEVFERESNINIRTPPTQPVASAPPLNCSEKNINVYQNNQNNHHCSEYYVSPNNINPTPSAPRLESMQSIINLMKYFEIK